MVRRAARGVALQAAGLVAVAMLLLILLVTIIVVREQTGVADDLLRSTVRTADDVADPPPNTWLVMTRGDVVSASDGVPGDLAPDLAQLRSAAGPTPVLVDLRDGEGNEYRVATEVRDGQTIQVVLDLAPTYRQRTRLLEVMGMAAAIGLLFAVLLGVLLGRRAVRPLAQALALQRTFIADAGHELRTPLTLLSTRAQVLDRAVQRSDLGEQVRQDSRGVVQDAQRLGDVVEDLLVAADPRGEEAHEPVDLVAMARTVVESAAAQAGQAKIGLTSQLGRDPLLVAGSAPALRRAVLALVDNAIDHTPAGGEVRVTLRRDRRDVIVSVSDTGPGIAPEQAQDVLRRFESGGQRAGRAHYGLGLALTHDVANRHGGQLRLVDSAVGATFELVLPALPADSANPQPAPRKR